tara:strand:+ start:1259 stop:1408 length:150 start_codon:yes stop_codon:yes gene_type:complete
MKNSLFISEAEGLTVTNFYVFNKGHDIKMIDLITIKTGSFKKAYKILAE